MKIPEYFLSNVFVSTHFYYLENTNKHLSRESQRNMYKQPNGTSGIHQLERKNYLKNLSIFIC